MGVSVTGSRSSAVLCFYACLWACSGSGPGILWAYPPRRPGHEKLSWRMMVASFSRKPCVFCAAAAAALSAPHVGHPATSQRPSAAGRNPSGVKCTPGLPRAHTGSYLGRRPVVAGLRREAGAAEVLEGMPAQWNVLCPAAGAAFSW